MVYFVTGATGFIGRFLIERLLEREGDIHVLVRKGSRKKLEALAERWGQPERIKPVEGDLSKPALGVSKSWIKAHKGKVDHFFHLAAMYDMTADDEQQPRSPTSDGTRHAVELANALDAGCFHQVSSVAAAGLYEGVFTEQMFDEGQPLEHPYHRTKFESEKIARTETEGSLARLPAGDRGRALADRRDGQDRRPLLPLQGAQDGRAPAGDHAAVRAADGRHEHRARSTSSPVRSTTSPTSRGSTARPSTSSAPSRRARSSSSTSSRRVAGAPRMTAALPSAALPLALKVPGVRGHLLPGLGIPAAAIDYVSFTARFDAAQTTKALAGSGIAVPPLEDYAATLWDYWERNLED